MTSSGSCSVQLSFIPNQSPLQIEATYEVLKNVSYSSDQEQKMDIYLSKNAKQLEDKNFTIIFLHGGGFYMSDKSQEEKYIEPYLSKGLNVVNMNYRLKRGIALATQDLTNVLHFLEANSVTYPFNLNQVILTGFSSGAQIASLVGLAANNPEYLNPLNKGIKLSGIINLAGPVDGLD